MNHLFASGWKAVNLKDWSGKDKEFILAFDDGYECIYEYVPAILEPLKFSATIFIPTGFIGRENIWDHHLYGIRFKHLSEIQIKELARSGWEIGSHTVSHIALENLSEVSVRSELLKSKIRLGEIVGDKIESISFPFGSYCDVALRTATELGYSQALTPQIRNDAINIECLDIYEADPVYLWDRFINLNGRLNRTGPWYQMGRTFRNSIGKFNRWTVFYRSMFPIPVSDLPDEE